MIKTAAFSIVYLTAHASALCYVQPLKGRPSCMRLPRLTSTATNGDSDIQPESAYISDHPLAAAASATKGPVSSSSSLDTVVSRLLSGLRDQFLRIKWDTIYAIHRLKEDRSTRRREYWRRIAASNHGDGFDRATKFDLLLIVQNWNEDLSKRQREYWRRIAATDHGDSVEGGRKFDFLYPKNNLLKALGLALTAAAIGFAVSTNQATVVATSVPAKQMLASSVTDTISDFVSKTGSQTETGAFLSWFVPWFLVVAVQKLY